MSKIEQIIAEIEDFIDGCKYQTLSNTKIIVNRDELEVSENHRKQRCDSERCAGQIR